MCVSHDIGKGRAVINADVVDVFAVAVAKVVMVEEEGGAKKPTKTKEFLQAVMVLAVDPNKRSE
jgi:Flp pilus assembly protein CpaB